MAIMVTNGCHGTGCLGELGKGECTYYEVEYDKALFARCMTDKAFRAGNVKDCEEVLAMASMSPSVSWCPQTTKPPLLTILPPSVSPPPVSTPPAVAAQAAESSPWPWVAGGVSLLGLAWVLFGKKG